MTLASRFDRLFMEWIHDKTEVKHFVKVRSKFQYFLQIIFEENIEIQDLFNIHTMIIRINTAGGKSPATLFVFKHCISAQKLHGPSDVSVCDLSKCRFQLPLAEPVSSALQPANTLRYQRGPVHWHGAVPAYCVTIHACLTWRKPNIAT